MVCDDTQRVVVPSGPETTRDHGTTYENKGCHTNETPWSRGPEQNHGTTYEKAVVPWSLKSRTTRDHAAQPIRSTAAEGTAMVVGPCAKARVTATITLPDGRVFRGTNDVRNPQPSCPRIGQAYARDDFRLCVEVCQQQGHAEAMALRAAGGWAPGAVVRVSHHRCCYACTAALTAAGVARIICEGAPL